MAVGACPLFSADRQDQRSSSSKPYRLSIGKSNIGKRRPEEYERQKHVMTLTVSNFRKWLILRTWFKGWMLADQL